MLYFPYITRNGALTNLLFFRGRISKIDSQRNAVEQVKEIVSPSLLPQKWEMDLAKNFFDERFAFMDSEWLPHGGVSLENELSGDFDLGEQQDPQPSTEPKRPRLSFSLKKREHDADKPEEDKYDDLEDARSMDPKDDGNAFKDSTNRQELSRGVVYCSVHRLINIYSNSFVFDPPTQKAINIVIMLGGGAGNNLYIQRGICIFL